MLTYPTGIKDANDLLVAAKDEAPAVFAQCVAAAPAVVPPPPVVPVVAVPPPAEPVPAVATDAAVVSLMRDRRHYHARVVSRVLGRLRTTVKVSAGSVFHVDTIDLYAARSRGEFARRAAKALTLDATVIEDDLLALLIAAEARTAPAVETPPAAAAPVMTEAERDEALALLRRPDFLDQVARDIDALGYVGEGTNTRLLYLVAISRKLADPLSAIILSQSGAGKSGLTEVLEQLTPPEDSLC